MWPRALAVGGALALLGSLFEPWYDGIAELVIVTRGSDGTTTSSGLDSGAATDAWSVLPWADVALATIAFAGLVLAFRRPAVACGLGVVAVGLVIGHAIVGPGGTEGPTTLAAGPAVALAGAVALSAGAWLTIRPGGFDQLAGMGALILCAALWMPWYAIAVEVGDLSFPPSGEGFQPVQGQVAGGTALGSAWSVFTVTDIALLVLALVTFVRVRRVAVGAALLAAALVLLRIVLPPEGLEPRAGAFIALGAALLAVVASSAPRRVALSA